MERNPRNETSNEYLFLTFFYQPFMLYTYFRKTRTLKSRNSKKRLFFTKTDRQRIKELVNKIMGLCRDMYFEK